jgi:hypothetical protein
VTGDGEQAELTFLAINQSRTTKEKTMRKKGFTVDMSGLAPTIGERFFG